jgi:hypothetical protein
VFLELSSVEKQIVVVLGYFFGGAESSKDLTTPTFAHPDWANDLPIEYEDEHDL